jgi:putative addiction module component (TIGR02574 family)
MNDLLALPREERAELALALIDSLDAPGEMLSPDAWARSWGPTISKRLDDVDSGRVATMSIEQAAEAMTSAIRDARNT